MIIRVNVLSSSPSLFIPASTMKPEFSPIALGQLLCYLTLFVLILGRIVGLILIGNEEAPLVSP